MGTKKGTEEKGQRDRNGDRGDTDRDRAIVITPETGTGVEGEGQLQRDGNRNRGMDRVTGRRTHRDRWTGTGIGNE